jgi:hypothetical protein
MGFKTGTVMWLCLVLLAGCVNQIREPANRIDDKGPAIIDPNGNGNGMAAGDTEDTGPASEGPSDPTGDPDNDQDGDFTGDPGDETNAGPATCGNGQIELGEICDGQALGDLTCRSAGFASGGEVSCLSNCQSVFTNGCSIPVANPIPLEGQTLPLAGSLSPSDPTWNRPNEACEPGTQSPAFFDAFSIVNNSDAPKQVRISATWNDGDGFLHLFQAAWNPMDGSGCTVGNDDHGGISGSQLPEFTMAAGQQLVVALSTATGGQTIDSYVLSVSTLDENGWPPAVDPSPGQGDVPATGCGSGTVDPGEVCDGAQLGGASCSALGHTSGYLACSEDCSLILNFCSDEDPAGPPLPPSTEPDPIPENAGNSGTTDTPAFGLTLQLSGSLDVNSPQWSRPDGGCDSRSDSGHLWQSHVLVNNTGATQEITLTANWNGDGYLFAYRGPFSASMPVAACLDGDDNYDDNSFSNSELGSRIEDLDLAPGEMLTVVASSHDPQDPIGDYRIDVTAQDPADSFPLAPLPAPGQILTSQGSLHGIEDTWHRDTETCDDDGPSGDYFYDSLYLENTTGSTLSIEVTSTWVGGDGMLHAYVLDGTSQSSGMEVCLAANDDFGGVAQSQLSAIVVFPFEVIQVVASTFVDEATVEAYEIQVRTLP